MATMTRKQLERRFRILKDTCTPEDTIESVFSRTWNLFCEYIGDSAVVSFADMELLNLTAFVFRDILKKYAFTKCDIFHKEYAEEAQPYNAVIVRVSKGNPDVLYIKKKKTTAFHNNPRDHFIPFGKAKNCFPDSEYATTEYLAFRDRIYSNEVHVYHPGEGQTYTYINEDDWERLQHDFPDFAKSFGIQSADYLNSLGYIEATDQVAKMMAKMLKKIHTIPVNEVSRLSFANVNGRMVEITYN